MKKSQNVVELEELAGSQWGLFTTAQAQSLGVRRNQISRMVDAGKIASASYGTYYLTMGEETDFLNVKAAWLSIYPKETVVERLRKGPDAVVAGRTAACVHGYGDFYAAPYVFTVNRRKQSTRSDLHLIKDEVDDGDIVTIDGLPVTTVERTVVDLLVSHEDPDLVDQMMSDSSRQGHVFDRERLSELLTPFAHKFDYRKHDGATFADDLIARNVAAIQMENAGKVLAQAFVSSYGADRASNILKNVMPDLQPLLTTDAFKDIQDSFGRTDLIDKAVMQGLSEGISQVMTPALSEMTSSVEAFLSLVVANGLRNSDEGKKHATPEVDAGQDVDVDPRPNSGGGDGRE